MGHLIGEPPIGDAVRLTSDPDGFPVGLAGSSHTGNPLAADGYVGSTDYVEPDPAVGGKPGAAMVLGYSTGFNGRATRTAPFTGRTIVPPQPMAHPAIGPVGRDNRANRLAAGVAQQSTDYLPDAQSIARAFVTGRGPSAFARRAANGES